MFVLENVCPKPLNQFILEFSNYEDIFSRAKKKKKKRINLLQDEEKYVKFSVLLLGKNRIWSWIIGI